MSSRGSHRPAARGSATVELALLAPLLVAFALLVVGLGRLAGARMTVEDAAHQAARAATLARDPATATTQAQTAAARTLDGQRPPCARHNVRVDTAGLRPGVTVRTEVTCRMRLRDVAMILPGTTTVAGSSAAVVDYYRGVDQP